MKSPPRVRRSTVVMPASPRRLLSHNRNANAKAKRASPVMPMTRLASPSASHQTRHRFERRWGGATDQSAPGPVFDLGDLLKWWRSEMNPETQSHFVTALLDELGDYLGKNQHRFIQRTDSPYQYMEAVLQSEEVAVQLFKQHIPQFNIPSDLAPRHLQFLTHLLDGPTKYESLVLFRDGCEMYGRDLADEYAIPRGYPGYEVSFKAKQRFPIEADRLSTTYRLAVIPFHPVTFPFLLLLDGNMVDSQRPHLFIAPHWSEMDIYSGKDKTIELRDIVDRVIYGLDRFHDYNENIRLKIQAEKDRQMKGAGAIRRLFR